MCRHLCCTCVCKCVHFVYRLSRQTCWIALIGWFLRFVRMSIKTAKQHQHEHSAHSLPSTLSSCQESLLISGRVWSECADNTHTQPHPPHTVIIYNYFFVLSWLSLQETLMTSLQLFECLFFMNTMFTIRRVVSCWWNTHISFFTNAKRFHLARV